VVSVVNQTIHGDGARTPTHTSLQGVQRLTAGDGP